MSKKHSLTAPKDLNTSIRINRTLRDDAAELYKKMGLSLSDAISVFLIASINAGGLPFELKNSLKSEVIRKANEKLRDEIQKGL